MRWRSGHLQASVNKHLKTGLTTLGWMDATPRWTETPFVWDPDHDTETVVAGGGPTATNTIGLSIGDIPDNAVLDLGGGLMSVNLPVFVDIYAENRSSARNVADDVQQILQGELWATSRYIPIYNFAEDPPVLDTDQALEARLVEARWATGGADFRRTWRVVSFTATCYFNGAGND